MRTTLAPALVVLALLSPVTTVRSDDTKSADKAAASAPSSQAKSEFTLPPGFQPKKRGKYTLYCRKEQVIGTRFSAEKCYDETGIREIVRAQREDQAKVDQMRRICGSLEACGGG